MYHNAVYKIADAGSKRVYAIVLRTYRGWYFFRKHYGTAPVDVEMKEKKNVSLFLLGGKMVS